MASTARAAPPGARRPPRGFTVIELLLSMSMGLLVIGGIYSTYLFFNNTYNAQAEIVEMQQTVDWLHKQLGDYLKVAGSGLVPGMDGAVTYDSSVQRITVITNTSGRVAKIASASPTGTTTIRVDSLSGFRVGGCLGLYDYATKTASQHLITALDTAARFVTFSPPTARDLSLYDDASSYDSVDFQVDGSMNLYRKVDTATTQLVAENVEAMQIRFFDKLGNLTGHSQPWASISGFQVLVRIREAHPDKNYYNTDYHDHYRRRERTFNIARRN